MVGSGLERRICWPMALHGGNTPAGGLKQLEEGTHCFYSCESCLSGPASRTFQFELLAGENKVAWE
jgi:hypothetical protein